MKMDEVGRDFLRRRRRARKPRDVALGPVDERTGEAVIDFSGMFSETEFDKLQVLADAAGKPLGEFIIRGVFEYIDYDGPKPALQ